MDRVNFTINGIPCSAGSEFTSDTTLNEYLRRHEDLRGTKYMCLEGGCGACVVNVQALHPRTRQRISFSVNSCLVLIMSCDGWDITTIEAIGNRKIGYNLIQRRLHQFFGSQCGYCSPGFVMSMYSLIQNRGDSLTEQEIEDSFGSNLCRCTGYRPILEAFKSLVKNPNKEIINKIKDIEDLSGQECPKSGKRCDDTCEEEWCVINIKDATDTVVPKKISLVDGRTWHIVSDIRSIFEVLNEAGYDSYMLVGGNTGRGVRPIKYFPKILIDVSNISELQTYYLDVNLVLGGNITLTDTMDIFCQLYKTNETFSYLKILYDHLQRVAHIPVRNIGTLAGNLVVKHEHPDFQSDIFLLFECVGAVITIVDSSMMETDMTLTNFMATSIVGKIIKLIKLPPLSQNHELVTFKVTPREQNAHAEVNSAFLFHFDPMLNILEARLVYGGISSPFTHAYNTESFLIGRNIFNNETLQESLKCLYEEIQPEFSPPDPSPWFRQKLGVSLFYKAVLRICPKNILNPIYASGCTTVTENRPPVSQSFQEYDTNEEDYPITQPLLKREGLIQCAGEANYVDDLPTIKDEIFAALVLSTVAKADIESIDASEALKVDGVLAVFTAANIPGINSFTRPGYGVIVEEEEFLASGTVKYYNQPVAVVAAVRQNLANQVTDLVKVKYKNVSDKPLVFTIEDAILAPKEENRIVTWVPITPTDRGSNVQKVVKGTFFSPRQYHFTMELHTTIVRPVDNGLEVISSSQHVDVIQAIIARLLKMNESSIIVQNRRCGGGFGCKIARSNIAACATALVARKLNKTCRMYMPIRDIMHAIGKRPNTRIDYEIGVQGNGEIQYFDGKFYINDGISKNENDNVFAIGAFKNCYDVRRWNISSYSTITDAPTNCFMRAPGQFEGISGIEFIMDHIADELDLDPISVRIANYRQNDNPLPQLVPDFLERIDYRKRKDHINNFNATNRWKKRGMEFTNMAYPTLYYGNYNALVSVYHGDGSVIINIGGIELGQGIYTRMAQVAAYELNVPVEKVSVLPTYNFATPNCFATVSSLTTECCAYAIIKSCEQLRERLAPVRADMPTATWEEIVFEADNRGILLQANFITGAQDPALQNYSIFGIAVVEVEVDVLTGRKWIVRADVFEDCGRSINPALDVGQVEGAFIQALSAWTIEHLIYNIHTGELYNDRTWNYKIFGAKDIPHDFRVYFRRRTANPVGILGSKAVGEPPSCMGQVIVNSLRHAIQASRYDSGYDTRGFLHVDVPVTNENVMKAADTNIEEYLLY